MSGFPTIKWFPKEDKTGKDYEGGRDLSSFVEYINKEAGTARNDDGSLSSKVWQAVTEAFHPVPRMPLGRVHRNAPWLKMMQEQSLLMASAALCTRGDGSFSPSA